MIYLFNMTEEQRRKSREYKQKYRLKKLGLLPPKTYNQTLIKVRATPPELTEAEASSKYHILIRRKKVDKVASRIQNSLSIEWRKRYKVPFIIVVEGGAIQKNVTMRYHVELYQMGMTDEVIKEFENLANNIVKQWQHEYDDVEL